VGVRVFVFWLFVFVSETTGDGFGDSEYICDTGTMVAARANDADHLR